MRRLDETLNGKNWNKKRENDGWQQERKEMGVTGELRSLMGDGKKGKKGMLRVSWDHSLVTAGRTRNDCYGWVETIDGWRPRGKEMGVSGESRPLTGDSREEKNGCYGEVDVIDGWRPRGKEMSVTGELRPFIGDGRKEKNGCYGWVEIVDGWQQEEEEMILWVTGTNWRGTETLWRAIITHWLITRIYCWLTIV